MYWKDYYTKLDIEFISREVKKEGFNPISISNHSGFVYAKHKHPETKLLVFLEGNMTVMVEGKTFLCQPGDKLIIPGNTFHEAIVGEKGCTFLWSEKLIE
jgi:quercetin dioxygenase-like cupin family protein